MPNIGTATFLTDVYAKWFDSYDNQKWSVVAGFDLQAAYDVLNIKIVLDKLKALGARKGVIEWLESFLDYRNIRFDLSTKVKMRKNGVKAKQV